MKIEFIVTINNKMEKNYLYDVFKVFSADGNAEKTVLVGRIMVNESTGLLKIHDFAGDMKKNEEKIMVAFKKNYEDDKKNFFH